ncbi:unnamed protein product, partial [Ectocarpus sp. 12 AP-2014]
NSVYGHPTWCRLRLGIRVYRIHDHLIEALGLSATCGVRLCTHSVVCDRASMCVLLSGEIDFLTASLHSNCDRALPVFFHPPEGGKPSPYAPDPWSRSKLGAKS